MADIEPVYMDFEYTHNPRRPLVNFEKRLDAVTSVMNIDPNLVNWKHLSSVDMSDREYIDYAKYLDWNIISERVDLDTALRLKEFIEWDMFLLTHTIDDLSVFDKIKVDLITILKTQMLTEQFIEDRMSEILSGGVKMWNALCKYQTLSENFLTKYWAKLNPMLVATFQSLSYGFIKAHIDDLNMDHIEANQSLTTFQKMCLREVRN